MAGPGWSLRERLLPDGGRCSGSAAACGSWSPGPRASPDSGSRPGPGEPGESDGVAVIEAADGTRQLARVPLCGCGDRGCGNIGIQLDKELDEGELAALAGVLRELPWGTTVPDRANVLRGRDLAALAP